MSGYFPKPKSFGANVKVKLSDLSDFATKADLKNATGVETSDFPKKTDLAHLKSDAEKLDIDKLEKVQTSLDSLKSKVDKLDVHELVHVPVDLGKLSVQQKMMLLKRLNITNWLKTLILFRLLMLVLRKTDYNKKINETEKKITDHDHSNKYVATKKFNKLTVKNLS